MARRPARRGRPRRTARARTPTGAWTGPGGAFTIVLPSQNKALGVAAGRLVLTDPANAGRVHLRARTGLRGVPRGRDLRHRQAVHRPTPWGEVKGMIDLHLHGMAFEFLGGDGALRQAVGPVRRAVRAGRLPRPPAGPTATAPSLENASLRQPAAPRPGRLADVQGLAGTRLADPRGHLLQVDRALLARRAAGLREPAGREQPALRALPAQAELLRRHGLDPPAGQGHATRCRTTSTRSTAAPARAGTASSRTRSRPGRVINAGQARRGHGHRDACRSAARRVSTTSRQCDAAQIDQQLDEVHRWACARWSWSTSSTTRWPAWPATTARPASWSTPPTSSRPAPSGTCGTARARPTAARQATSAAPGIDPEQRRRALRAIEQFLPLGGRAGLPAAPHCNARGLTTLGEHTIRRRWRSG